MAGHLLDHASDDAGVLVEQIHSAHPGLTGKSRRDDDDVRAGSLAVVVRAHDVRLEAFDRRRLPHVESQSLGQTFDDVDHHHLVGQALLHDPHRGSRPDEPTSNHGHPQFDRLRCKREPSGGILRIFRGPAEWAADYEAGATERSTLRSPACSSISRKSCGCDEAWSASSIVIKSWRTSPSNDWSNVCIP